MATISTERSAHDQIREAIHQVPGLHIAYESPPAVTPLAEGGNVTMLEASYHFAPEVPSFDITSLGDLAFRLRVEPSNPQWFNVYDPSFEEGIGGNTGVLRLPLLTIFEQLDTDPPEVLNLEDLKELWRTDVAERRVRLLGKTFLYTKLIVFPSHELAAQVPEPSSDSTRLEISDRKLGRRLRKSQKTWNRANY